MSIDKEILLNAYIPFGLSVPCGEWEVSPIKVKDWYDVSDIVYYLEMDKNTLGKVELIQCSNLSFFLGVFSNDNTLAAKFERFLRLCLGIDDDEYITISNSGNELKVGYAEKMDGDKIILQSGTERIISAEDFDEIRRISLFQNVYDYDDAYVDPAVKKAAEEYWALKNRETPTPTMEHKVICVQMKTGMTMETIGDLCIRNFNQIFNTIAEESDYLAHKIAQCNGVKFNKPLQHWAFKEKKNKYAEAFSDADSFTNKIKNA